MSLRTGAGTGLGLTRVKNVERPPDHKTEASGEAGSLWLQARCLVHQVWGVGRRLGDLASVISLH